MDSNAVVGLIKREIAGRDAQGNYVYSETLTALPGIYAPGGTTELLNGQDIVTALPEVYLPTGTDVTAIDVVIPQLVVDSSGVPVLDGQGNGQGERYEVNGKPSAWPPNPFSGWQPDISVVVPLKRVTG